MAPPALVAPPVIGSFTRIVSDNAAATSAETSAAAETTAEAGAPVVVETPVAGAPVVIGSFTPIDVDTAAKTAAGTAAETSAAAVVVETSAAADAVVIPTAAPSIRSFSQIALGTGVTPPASLAPLPTPGGNFIFTNSSTVDASGVAQATGGLAPLPGIAAPSGGLQQLPGVAAPSGGLQPLPGLNTGAEATVTGADGSSPTLQPLPGSPDLNGTDSLQSLPTGGVSASETLEVDGVTASGNALNALPTGDAVSSALTTLTTEVNGVATTLITAVAVTTTGSAQATGAGVAGNSSALRPVPTAAAEKVKTSLITAMGGAAGVLVFLML